jgi:hypothetical protein
MDVIAHTSVKRRRPRFCRAPDPLAFRLTEDDVLIVRQLALYRFLRSTHIASLVGRSLDRTNDRLMRLFHSGYIDRPRAQLDYYPAAGSAPMVYALGDRGARLLAERGTRIDAAERSRKNNESGRAFIEHQLEIVDFHVTLEQAARRQGGLRIIQPEEIVASSPEQTRAMRNPLGLRVGVGHNGSTHEIGLIPDLIFGLMFPHGGRRCFMVEIDRGTMPISRSDLRQTSIERKMRAYLAAEAAKQHQLHFGWKTFRVLVVTTDNQRLRSMQETVRRLQVPNSIGASLFLFATRSALQTPDPLTHLWRDGNNREVNLLAK